MSGFRAMLEASQKGTERSMEQQYRESEFPEICTPECKHRTCPYYRQENFGKACKMRLEQYKTPKNVNLPIQRQIEKAIEKAFEPYENRLKRIEEYAQNYTKNRSFNGTDLPIIYHETLNPNRIGD